MTSAAAEKVSAMIEQRERTLRIDLIKIFDDQRAKLPVTRIVEGSGLPVDVIVDWENQFYDWFLSRREFWASAWSRSARVEVKLTAQESFDDFISTRSLEIGGQLASVSEAGVQLALRNFSTGSLQNLKRELKKSIGLQPRQTSALIKQSAAINKAYPPARAKVLIDRLHRKKLNYRAQLIARTEMSNAINQAQMADINTRVAEGRLDQQEKRWSTIGDDRVSDGCTTNEAEGWILFKDTFISGHDAPPRFPGCRCGMQFRKKQGARLVRPEAQIRFEKSVVSKSKQDLRTKRIRKAPTFPDSAERSKAIKSLSSKSNIPEIEEWLNTLPTSMLEEIDGVVDAIKYKKLGKDVLGGFLPDITDAGKAKIWINEAAEKIAERRYQTFVHEVGHVLDESRILSREIRVKRREVFYNIDVNFPKQEKLSVEIRKFRKKNRGILVEDLEAQFSDRLISVYGTQDESEYFAEAIRDYVTGGVQLTKSNPELYNLLKTDIFEGVVYPK